MGVTELMTLLWARAMASRSQSPLVSNSSSDSPRVEDESEGLLVSEWKGIKKVCSEIFSISILSKQFLTPKSPIITVPLPLRTSPALIQPLLDTLHPSTLMAKLFIKTPIPRMIIVTDPPSNGSAKNVIAIEIGVFFIFEDRFWFFSGD